MLYGTDGITPVKRTDRLAEIYPALEDRWQQRAQGEDVSDADIIRVRKPSEHTWLKSDATHEFPLPWKEGRPRAQKIK